jgi:GNAT superfamily N-acetyltransferase
MNDTEKLLKIYRDQPCQTLPNAFWKSITGAVQNNLIVQRDLFGALQSIALWQGERLMSLWFDDPKHSLLSRQQIDGLRFALVHNDCLSLFNPQKFSEATAYFRLIHKNAPPIDGCPPGFVYQTVNPQRDVSLITSMISACYENIKISEEIVQSWMGHPVYDPRLWVWVKDINADRFAALGIADLDIRVPEASLEWIQVHPDYQSRGLGLAIVGELLRRAADEADFTTVSGEVNNPSQPEKLYRRCGFGGSDIWWLLKV